MTVQVEASGRRSVNMDVGQLAHLALRTAPTAVAVIDGGGEFVYVSPSSYRILGHRKSVIGRNVVEFIHPDDLEAALVSMAGTVERAGVAEPITLRFARGDGSWEWIDLVAAPLSEETDGVAGLIIAARTAASSAVDEGTGQRLGGLDDAQVPCVVLDGRGEVVRLNLAASATLGVDADRMHELDGFGPFLEALASGGGRGQLETRHGEVHIRWTGTVQRDRRGEPAFFVLTGTDVTAERQAQAALRQREAWLQSIVANTSDVILVVDGDRHATFVTPSVQAVLGREVDSILGADIEHLVLEEDHAHLGELLASAAIGPGETVRGQLRMTTPAGAVRHMDVSAVCLDGTGGMNGTLLTAHDVTSRFEREAELERRSLYDHLTGLPNRVLLFDRLAVSLRRRHARGSAILFVDLDGFKAVNDTFGHEVGDEVLVEVASRLLAIARKGDTVARLAGDEFVVLIEDVESTADAATIAHRIVEGIAAPFVTSRGVARIGASVGICLARGDRDPESAVREADQAMYQAKRSGKGSFSFSDLASSAG